MPERDATKYYLFEIQERENLAQRRCLAEGSLEWKKIQKTRAKASTLENITTEAFTYIISIKTHSGINTSPAQVIQKKIVRPKESK